MGGGLDYFRLADKPGVIAWVLESNAEFGRSSRSE